MPINSTDTTTGFAPSDLGRFRGDERAPAWALDNLPYDLLEGYGKVARYGKYGKEGVESITGAMRRNSALSRRLRRKGMLRRLSSGRRLGPRAGAVQTQMANQFYRPSELAANERGSMLRAENLGSRTEGLAGIRSVMEFLQRQYNVDRERDDEGGTPWGDILKLTGRAAAAYFSGGTSEVPYAATAE